MDESGSRSDGVDSASFRRAISAFASGVTVVTTLRDGSPVGMTASAVSSLSLDPVLLLVCINTRLTTHHAIAETKRFVINVLGEGQEGLALHFARKAGDKFAGIGLRDQHDLPVLADAIAYFVCDLHEQFPGGDHSIFTGLVRDCGVENWRRPLVYFQSSFGSIRDHDQERAEETALWDAISYGIVS
jgi:flavin reductase (DIM6/NTAB) family NADH-FMN oxidoreductase RutF